MTPTETKPKTWSLFQRERPSLFGEILDWMLTPMLLLWPVSLVLTSWVAQSVSGRPFDRALEFNARAVASLVVAQPVNAASTAERGIQVNFPASARELLRADEADTVYYQVLGLRGEFVTGERDLPLPEADAPRVVGEVFLRDDAYRGSDLRVAWIYVPVGAPGAQPALVQVAETTDKRTTLANEIVRGLMVPLFVTLPLAVLLAWFALTRGMRPIRTLEQTIRARKPEDLSPIDDHYAPQELAPLVDSLNSHLLRLKSSISHQKRFLADAAHQLKTPLAGVRTQAELALRNAASEADLKQSLKLVSQSSIRAAHTVNQLLALSRAESSGLSVSKTQVNLVAIVQEAVQDQLTAALDRNIDLGYEGAQTSDAVPLLGNSVLLKELVRNLLENAIHYTPAGGVVTARVLLDRFTGAQVLQIEDSGPGIPGSERDLVLQPFYRVLGTGVDGSGLGLAIVVEIAKQHAAELRIGDARPLQIPPGALMTVRFAPEEPAGDND